MVPRVLARSVVQVDRAPLHLRQTHRDRQPASGHLVGAARLSPAQLAEPQWSIWDGRTGTIDWPGRKNCRKPAAEQFAKQAGTFVAQGTCLASLVCVYSESLTHITK